MPDDDQNARRRAKELYVSWTLVEDAKPVRGPFLTLGDLVAFFVEGKWFNKELLFSNPRLLADYQRLKREYAWIRAAWIRAAVHATVSGPRPEGTGILELSPVIAAAGDEGVDERTFEGGTVQIRPSAAGRQVYVLLTMDDPRDSPGSLLIDDMARTTLEPPDAEGRIFLIKDLADEDDALFVRLLRNPASTGIFLK
jgi:hypothetical protein